MKISEASQLLNSIYSDWHPFLSNSRGIRNGLCITWADRVPRMLDHPVMASHVIALADDRQYTFQVSKDGSIIQMYYSYDKRGVVLQEARLAFYSANPDDRSSLERGLVAEPNVVPVESEQIEEETRIAENTSESIVDIMEAEKDGRVSWLRIEYAPHEAKGILHHDCHMHFSAFPHSRFVVAGVPTPKQFVEFIMAFCYPDFYRLHRLDKEGQYVSETKIQAVNSICVPWVESKVFSQIAHFRIPNLGMSQYV